MTACKTDKKSEDVLAQDSTLTRDLALANRDTTVRPQLNDVPKNVAPAAPAPTGPHQVTRRHQTPPPAPPPPPQNNQAPPLPPAPPASTPSGNTVTAASSGTANSEGQVGTIPAGTTLALASGQQVCTNTNNVGDRFTAALSEAVTASNGAVLPAGATAVLEVTSLKPSQRAGDNMVIGLTVRSIAYGGKTYPINGEITSAQTQQVKAANNDDAKKVLGGAAIGAVLGNIFGGGSRAVRTVVGAAGGAAAGAVVAHQTAKYNACIPAGGQITVRLDQAMQVQSLGGGSGGGI
jgi:outer membrane lipoprotein SlyB